MSTREPCKLTGNIQKASDHYVALLGIIEQAQTAGLKLDGLLSQVQEGSVPETIPLAEVGEWIRDTRRKLYLQMMEFEILDNDLADLQSELLETSEGCATPAVTLSLV